MDRWSDPQYREWAKAVKARDRYICRVCGDDKLLQSHHLFSWDRYVELRFNIDNGANLCYNCHEAFHCAYGKGNNTPFQFIEWLKSRQIIKEAIESKEKEQDEEDFTGGFQEESR